MGNERIKFKPLFDWSTYALIAFIVVACGWPLFLDASWLMISIVLACIAFCMLPFFGTWYEIQGDDLIVYAFWRPSRFPISKIKEVAPADSMLAAPATSLVKRLAITFTDRKVLKSSMPIMISPANQQKFIDTLLSINPNIIIKQTLINQKNA